jgi:hypothetical protein
MDLMRKLTLKLDTLAVNSFEPLPREEGDRGTVLGREAPTFICITTPAPATTDCLTQTSPPTADC